MTESGGTPRTFRYTDKLAASGLPGAIGMPLPALGQRGEAWRGATPRTRSESVESAGASRRSGSDRSAHPKRRAWPCAADRDWAGHESAIAEVRSDARSLENDLAEQANLLDVESGFLRLQIVGHELRRRHQQAARQTSQESRLTLLSLPTDSTQLWTGSNSSDWMVLVWAVRSPCVSV